MNNEKELEITPDKAFWCIVREADPNGFHTGGEWSKIVLVQFDEPQQLSNFIEDGVVEAGESMGDYVFNVLAQSHSPDVLEQIIQADILARLEEDE